MSHERWARKCTAMNRQGNPCAKFAMRGSEVCSLHGGKSPQALAAAKRRLSVVRAERELDRLGQPVVIDPTAGLLSMVHEAAGNVAVLRLIVQKLPSVIDENGREHPIAELYRVWCDRLADYCARALRAGVEERQVEIEASMAVLLGQLIRDLLTAPELALDVEHQTIGLEVAGRLMRALPSVS